MTGVYNDTTLLRPIYCLERGMAMNTLRIVCLLCVNVALSQSAGAAWTWTKLDFPGAEWTRASGISGDTIVGDYGDSNGSYGFIYDGNTWISLAHPEAPRDTAATGISDGRIVGYYSPDNFQRYAFIYDGMTWTNVKVSGETRLLDVSGDKAVGYFDYNPWGSSRYTGLLYDGQGWQPLDFPGSNYTAIWGIWEDTIVGVYDVAYPTHSPARGFIYDGQTWTTVARDGAETTRLLGIEGDRMVGTWYGDNYSRTGFLLDGETWTDFACPWSTQTEAYGISGDRIVGYYRDTDGNAHGYLLTIPEPTAAALLAIGGLALARRRRAGQTRKGGR